ncbi:hypothetical protein [Azospirillum thiophilum]|uniref:hypothetical protein n=1 Tax=Azospirillum thiophilum TaxID=528244 RepID=UPI0006979D98|nr:hypothetical protein [Azospirillum thiophilum]
MTISFLRGARRPGWGKTAFGRRAAMREERHGRASGSRGYPVAPPQVTLAPERAQNGYSFPA